MSVNSWLSQALRCVAKTTFQALKAFAPSTGPHKSTTSESISNAASRRVRTHSPLGSFVTHARKQSSGSATPRAVTKSLSALTAYTPSTSIVSSSSRYGPISIISFGSFSGSELEPINTVSPLAHASTSLPLALTHDAPTATSFGSLPTPSTYTNASPANATNDSLFEHHFNARTGFASVISPNFSPIALPSLASRAA